MRIYIKGEFGNVIPNDFVIRSLIMSKDKIHEKETDLIRTIKLDGRVIDSSVNGNKYSCRWKGVDFDSGYAEYELFESDEILSLINDGFTIQGIVISGKKPQGFALTSISIVDGEFENTVELTDNKYMKHPVIFAEE